MDETSTNINKKPTKIKELFSNKDKWAKGAFARDCDGDAVNIESKFAVCFCLSGALQLVCGNDAAREGEIRLKIMEKIGHDNSITEWNDAPERTFEEVKQLVEELDI